jgi:glucose-induced degradation protein 8
VRVGDEHSRLPGHLSFFNPYLSKKTKKFKTHTPRTQGYVDAARAFAEETGTPPGADLAAIADRVAVRAALASGDVGRAIEATNDLDPAILEERPALAFALQRQALIELARAGQADAALAYAREYLAPRGEDDPGLLDELERAVALLAFPDPAASPLADLLSPAQRSATAAALNAAILDAQGQAGEARLPGLVRLLGWAQGRLSARGVKFPQLADPVRGGWAGLGDEPS